MSIFPKCKANLVTPSLKSDAQTKNMASIKKQEIENRFLKGYEEFSDGIFRFCLFKISDRELAKDLTQEVFARVWKYLSAGHAVDNMKAFLYRVANNLVVDEYRKKKGVSLDRLMEDGFDVSLNDEKRIYDLIDGREAVKILNKVDEKYKEVIKMRYLDGLLPKEIALILHESENSISVRINRGLKKVKKLINRE